MEALQRGSCKKKQDQSLEWFFKIGAVAALIILVLAGIGNLLHPETTDLPAQRVAQVIAGSQAWTALHLIIVVG
jgi:hypothetical protein